MVNKITFHDALSFFEMMTPEALEKRVQEEKVKEPEKGITAGAEIDACLEVLKNPPPDFDEQEVFRAREAVLLCLKSAPDPLQKSLQAAQKTLEAVRKPFGFGWKSLPATLFNRIFASAPATQDLPLSNEQKGDVETILTENPALEKPFREFCALLPKARAENAKGVRGGKQNQALMKKMAPLSRQQQLDPILSLLYESAFPLESVMKEVDELMGRPYDKESLQHLVDGNLSAQKSLRELCHAVRVTRELNLRRLKEGVARIDIVEGKQNPIDPYIFLGELLRTRDGEEVNPVTGLIIDLVDRAYPDNRQIHSDGLLLGLFDYQFDLGDPKSIDKVLDKLGNDHKATRALLAHFKNPAEKRLEAIAKTTEETVMPSYLYHNRKTEYLQQTEGWVDVEYYEKGGLKSAKRIIGFLPKGGQEKIVEIPLELSIEDRDKSKELMEFARESFEACSNWSDLMDHVHAEMQKGHSVTVEEARAFLKVKNKQFEYIVTKLKIPEQFATIIDFNWRVYHALAEALLTCS